MKSSDVLNKHKTKLKNNEKSGIYRIPCAQCNSVYIGQTKRNFETRLSEHRRASGYNKKKNIYNQNKLKIDLSAVAEHRHNSGHTIDWESARVIKPCHKNLLNISEQLCIFKQNNILNRREDDKFPRVWRNVIEREPDA